MRIALALIALFAMCVALVAACGAEDEPTPTSVPPTATAIPQPTSTAAPEPTATATEADIDMVNDDDDAADLPALIRDKTMQLWDVYNTYDVDGLEVFYAPSYWEEQEAALRTNIVTFQNAGAILTAEETSPPTEVSAGVWELRQFVTSGPSVAFPFRLVYEQFGDEWLLTFAELDSA